MVQSEVLCLIGPTPGRAKPYVQTDKIKSESGKSKERQDRKGVSYRGMAQTLKGVTSPTKIPQHAEEALFVLTIPEACPLSGQSILNKNFQAMGRDSVLRPFNVWSVSNILQTY